MMLCARELEEGGLSEDDDDGSDEEDEEDITGSSDDSGGHGTHFRFLEFSTIQRQERACIRRNLYERNPDADERQLFSLAFSGGGMRAAAFQAGVLWRLAEADQVKNIEYFAAVSGGAYIASAFATHCFENEPEKPERGTLREWYLGVVAKTICRMQSNAGNFVRDCVADPCGTEDGASCLPRICDLPMLVVTMIFCIFTVLLWQLNTTYWIITICGELFFGSAMRAAFCTARPTETWWLHKATAIFLQYSPLTHICWGACVSGFAAFVMFLLQRVVPRCVPQQLRKTLGAGLIERPEATMLYLWGHATEAVLVRLTICLSLIAVAPYVATFLQVNEYSMYGSLRPQLCLDYIKSMREDTLPLGVLKCSESVADTQQPWWEDPEIFESVREMLTTKSNRSDAVSDIAAGLDAEEEGDGKGLLPWFFPLFGNRHLFLKYFQILVLISALGTCCIPFFGTSLLVQILSFSGPMFFLISVVSALQYRIYGPITANTLGMIPWSVNKWDIWAHASLVGTLVFLPLFEEIRCVWHIYYKKTLQRNFFRGGKDVLFKDLSKNPYCPFLLFTGTSSDYQPPGDADTISELSFTALHFGGEETGYVPMAAYRGLAKYTALTAAGALDAFSLTMNDQIAVRLWLEILHLTWGDYVTLRPQETRFAPLLKRLGLSAGSFGRTKIRFCSIMVLFFGFALLYWGWMSMMSGSMDCAQARTTVASGVGVFCLMVVLSFYSFLPFLEFLALSPLFRQIHKFTKYVYVGKSPPPMLYITDGGVSDCTALVQLLWRRRERILLVLAAADPHDDFGVLRAGMRVARELKLASFYDPDDPRNDVDKLLDEFKLDAERCHLHMGISYCWGAAEGRRKTGHLFIVKNRLPPHLACSQIPPLLTEEEICGEREISSDGDGDTDHDEWTGMAPEDLGPLGCCDCCHTRGLNCGRKFPHGNFAGYLYLTPQWFNNLARLGHTVSESAVEAIARHEALEAPWESKINVPPL